MCILSGEGVGNIKVMSFFDDPIVKKFLFGGFIKGFLRHTPS